MKNKVSLKKPTTTTSNLSKEVETNKNQVEMLEVKNAVTQTSSSVDGLNSREGTEVTHELEDGPTDIT